MKSVELMIFVVPRNTRCLSNWKRNMTRLWSNLPELSDSNLKNLSSQELTELERLKDLTNFCFFGRNPINDETYKFLRGSNGHFARFYGLPKIHKSGSHLRPIVSFVNSPSGNVSRYLARILSRIIGNTAITVKSWVSLCWICKWWISWRRPITRTVHLPKILVDLAIKFAKDGNDEY